MIHLDQDQELFEDKNLRVANPTGNYDDAELIECYHVDDPKITVGAFQAQYVKYGNMIYRFNEPRELGPEILKIDPTSTHTAAVLVRMTDELLTQAQEGSLTEGSLDEVRAEEQAKIDEQIAEEEIKEEDEKEDEENTGEEENEEEVEEEPKEEIPEESPEEDPDSLPAEESPVGEGPAIDVPVIDEELPVEEVIIPEESIVPPEVVPVIEETVTEGPVGLLRRKKRRKVA